ncbi:Acyl carrier protein 3 mitochondrial [Bienertia sinuspersici]
MQTIKTSILGHIRLQPPRNWSSTDFASVRNKYSRQLCTLVGLNDDQILDRVIGLVRNFNKIDAAKSGASYGLGTGVSIEIPETEADKLSCCSDVAKYISAVSKQGSAQKS